MQTLGLSDATPRTENLLKSLFWPSISTGSDVDYLGTQGYWLCTIVAIVSLIFSGLAQQWFFGFIIMLFFYLGGVGVRERSRYAAAVVLLMFGADTLIAHLGVLRVILTALLLSNLRATWIAALWKPGSEDAILPPRLNETWRDKLSDRFPMWLWPKIELVYYGYSAAVLILVGIGWWAILNRHAA